MHQSCAVAQHFGARAEGANARMRSSNRSRINTLRKNEHFWAMGENSHLVFATERPYRVNPRGATRWNISGEQTSSSQDEA
jgi:hypothetical protein